MPRYHHKPIAELAHQLKLSPMRLRLKQLDATEYVVDLIQADKSYPYDFICHQITGYRPKVVTPCKAMLGKSLIEDLVELADDVSSSGPVSVELMPVACWSTEELAGRLKVSTKTICRWRRRGLVGRKLRYPDHSIRMAFSERTIRRFVVRNQELVRRGAAFSQLTQEEKQRIIELAQQLLAEQPMRLHELAQVVAAKVGRAVETVRYTLRRYDQARPERALFRPHRDQPLRNDHLHIYEQIRGGAAPEQIAKQLGQPVADILRIAHQTRIALLITREITCIHNPEFDAPDADTIILSDCPVSETKAQKSKPPRELPPYLQDLYRQPLLSAEQERSLFRRYNYLKYRANQLRQSGNLTLASETILAQIESLLKQADDCRNEILNANLRLVVSIARRHVGRCPHFFEIVSDGNLALMRAVEKFDYARGYKFSTYASWAIMRNYARTIPEQLYQSARMVTGSDELLAVASTSDSTANDSVLDGIRHLLNKGLALLTARERDIVVRHYGLNNGGHAMTLDQIGRSFGVTKERIRQIERKAIRKLQTALEEA